jgi:hypothetical protein
VLHDIRTTGDKLREVTLAEKCSLQKPAQNFHGRGNKREQKCIKKGKKREKVKKKAKYDDFFHKKTGIKGVIRPFLWFIWLKKRKLCLKKPGQSFGGESGGHASRVEGAGMESTFLVRPMSSNS